MEVQICLRLDEAYARDLDRRLLPLSSRLLSIHFSAALLGALLLYLLLPWTMPYKLSLAAGILTAALVDQKIAAKKRRRAYLSGQPDTLEFFLSPDGLQFREDFGGPRSHCTLREITLLDNSSDAVLLRLPERMGKTLLLLRQRDFFQGRLEALRTELLPLLSPAEEETLRSLRRPMRPLSVLCLMASACVFIVALLSEAEPSFNTEEPVHGGPYCVFEGDSHFYVDYTAHLSVVLEEYGTTYTSLIETRRQGEFAQIVREGAHRCELRFDFDGSPFPPIRFRESYRLESVPTGDYDCDWLYYRQGDSDSPCYTLLAAGDFLSHTATAIQEYLQDCPYDSQVQLNGRTCDLHKGKCDAKFFLYPLYLDQSAWYWLSASAGTGRCIPTEHQLVLSGQDQICPLLIWRDPESGKALRIRIDLQPVAEAAWHTSYQAVYPLWEDGSYSLDGSGSYLQYDLSYPDSSAQSTPLNAKRPASP